MSKQIKPHEPEEELLGPEDVAKDLAVLEQAFAHRRSKQIREWKKAYFDAGVDITTNQWDETNSIRSILGFAVIYGLGIVRGALREI